MTVLTLAKQIPVGASEGDSDGSGVGGGVGNGVGRGVGAGVGGGVKLLELTSSTNLDQKFSSSCKRLSRSIFVAAILGAKLRRSTKRA